MSRIQPLTGGEIKEPVQNAFELHVKEFNSRITNMKKTLGYSLPAFEVYMGWYPLYQEVENILGKRLAYLYAYSISHSADCLLCTTFFRKIIIDSGENPTKLRLCDQEQDVINFGNAVAEHKGNIANHIYNSIAQHYSKESLVLLIAFAGQMIATNIFNNVVETDIDEYLEEYTPVCLKSCL